LLTLLLSLSRTASAELLPEEIAIIAARGSKESEGLAKYYAQQRGIPLANICTVDMPRGEVLDREKWRWAVRPEIYKWITEHDPKEKLKCLVTVYDVPLKIGPAPAEELKSYREFLQAEREARVSQLNRIVEFFNEIASEIAEAPSAEQPKPPAGDKSEVAQLKDKLEQALQAAQRRSSKLSDPQKRVAQQLRIQQFASAAGGINVLLGALGQRIQQQQQQGGDLPANARSDFDALRGQAAGLAEAKALLDQEAIAAERDAIIISLIDRANGIAASVEWLDQQLKDAEKNETGASFDSELSLIMWEDGYQLLRWQPNYLRTAYDNSQLRKIHRTMMVSRLDAPTILLAKGLVDSAIKVEKDGLKGTAYFDARGLAKPDQQATPGSYEDYDRALIHTAEGVKQQTDVPMVLDDKPGLFQPGQCPNAALYCGWYSLGKYVDAFEWAPGAVGYHLASSEAVTLHDENSQAWCKRMLEDGVAATIGPVYEPYLFAFPRPEEFFALLLRGELPLVECYYRTQPLNSWMMVLIGDPLYTPYKNHPQKNVGKPQTPNPATGSPPPAAASAATAAPPTPADAPSVAAPPK
jgi:uncharacterized protein (TIGR03790 family)